MDAFVMRENENQIFTPRMKSQGAGLQVPQKTGLKPQAVDGSIKKRKALGDLSSSQINARTAGSEAKKSQLAEKPTMKPMILYQDPTPVVTPKVSTVDEEMLCTRFHQEEDFYDTMIKISKSKKLAICSAPAERVDGRENPHASILNNIDLTLTDVDDILSGPSSSEVPVPAPIFEDFDLESLLDEV